jgi:hypothetical protein
MGIKTEPSFAKWHQTWKTIVLLPRPLGPWINLQLWLPEDAMAHERQFGGGASRLLYMNRRPPAMSMHSRQKGDLTGIIAILP